MAVGAALIGALRVTLGLDSAQFEAGTKRARSIAKRDATAIQKELSRVRDGFNNLMKGVAVGALVAAGKRALDYASSLGEVAQQLGVTTAELQEYRYAAGQAGISTEEIDKSLAKLTKTIGEALAGEKSQVAAFRELGIALQDANGRVYSAGELIPKLADAFARIEDPAKRARLETDLFGRAGQKLDTLLAGGSQAINELRDAAHRLGIVLSDEQIQKADETADKLAAIKMVLEARIAGVVSDNADAILKIGDALGYAAAQVGQFFKNMQGVERLKRDQGWGAGFFASWQDQATAADPKSYVAKRMNDLRQATAARKSAEAGAGRNDQWGVRDRARLGTLREREQEALRLLRAARADPQYQALVTGNRAAKPSPVIGEGALPVATSGGGGRKRGGGGERDRTAEYLERFNREMASLADEQLRLTIEQTTSLDERAQLEAKRIKTELDAYKIEIESRRKSGELTTLQAEKLVLAREEKAAAEQAIMWDRINGEKQDNLNRLLQLDIDAREDALRIELDSARTQDERRQLGLRLLELDYEREKAALEHIKAMLALNQATQEEVDAAERRLANFESQRKGREAAVRRDTMGPLERYIDSFPKDAKELNEAYESVATQGLQSLNDGLAEAILQSKSLGDVFNNLANQIITDLARIAIQQTIVKPLAKMLFGDGEGGSGGGGLLSSIGKLFGLGSGSSGSVLTLSKTDNLPKLATGGSFMAGGLSGTDRNVLAINGIPKVRVSHDERISVQRSGQDNERPIVIQVVGEESSAFIPKVTGIAGTESVRVVSGVAKRQVRTGRSRLA
jgi:hypothetical protein